MTGDTNKKSMDLWSLRYQNEGFLWGDAPSPTVRHLIPHLLPRSHVFEIGFGYGRDLVAMAQRGHKISGIEQSSVGLKYARSKIKQATKARPRLYEGDFTTCLIPEGVFDAIYSHRVLHLILDQNNTALLAEKAARLLKPDGLLYVSARNFKDFNPEQMIKRPDGLCEYKNRTGHTISFWDEERFRAVFSKHFHITSFAEGREQESITNPAQSFFTIMTAQKI